MKSDLEDGIHEVVAGVEAEGHGGQLGLSGVLELDVETQPLGCLPECLPQGRYPAGTSTSSASFTCWEICSDSQRGSSGVDLPTHLWKDSLN